MPARNTIVQPEPGNSEPAALQKSGRMRSESQDSVRVVLLGGVARMRNRFGIRSGERVLHVARSTVWLILGVHCVSKCLLQARPILSYFRLNSWLTLCAPK